MKKILMLLTMLTVFFPTQVDAQIKVTGDGNVGIHTTQPAYKLDINAMDTRSYYSGRNALHINHNGIDPRLCSDDKVVFYRTDGTGYAKIESQRCLHPADRLIKENIISLQNKGLVIISKLKGFSFNSKTEPFKRREFGLLAQDVETVLPEAVFTNDSTNIKSLDYNMIIPYLVEAIKEQQIQLKEMAGKITNLQEILNQNKVPVSLGAAESSGPVLETGRLEQNIPNPFSMKTDINCFIPASATSSILYSYDVNGTPLQQFHITGTGNQVVTVDGSRMLPGIYFYSLIVDGKKVDTKKMILSK